MSFIHFLVLFTASIHLLLTKDQRITVFPLEIVRLSEIHTVKIVVTYGTYTHTYHMPSFRIIKFNEEIKQQHQEIRAETQ